MLAAPIPDDESDRLQALRCYEILDSKAPPCIQSMTRLAAEMCDCPVALITLIDEKRQWFFTKTGFPEEVTETSRDISFCGHVVFRKKTMHIPDTLKDICFSDNPFVLQDPPIRFYLGVPLINRDGFALGTLCVIDHVPRTISPKQIKLLEMLRDVIVQRLDNNLDLRAHTDQLNYLATHDKLTGLLNRFEFERRLDRILTESESEKSEHVLCYMDLDNFKQVNDSFGHIAGDYLLQEISKLFDQHIRNRDTLARVGGDEFALIMEHCSIKQAQNVTKKLIKALIDSEINIEGHRIDIGISIGIIPVDYECKNKIQILKRVDEACYTAKKAGRNQIHVAEPA